MNLRDRDLVPDKKKGIDKKSFAFLLGVSAFAGFLASILIHYVWLFPYKVNESFMTPAYPKGSRIYMNRLFNREKLKRGDVVLVKHPASPGIYMLRRVVGLSGDQVQLIDNRLIINGVHLNEPWEEKIENNINGNLPTLPSNISTQNNFGPISVPAGELFVLADNRIEGIDSRHVQGINFTLIAGRFF